MFNQITPLPHASHELLLPPAHPLIQQQMRICKHLRIKKRRTPPFFPSTSCPLPVPTVVLLSAGEKPLSSPQQYAQRFERLLRFSVDIIDIDDPTVATRLPQLSLGGRLQLFGYRGTDEGIGGRGRHVEVCGDGQVGRGEVEVVQLL